MIMINSYAKLGVAMALCVWGGRLLRRNNGCFFSFLCVPIILRFKVEWSIKEGTIKSTFISLESCPFLFCLFVIRPRYMFREPRVEMNDYLIISWKLMWIRWLWATLNRTRQHGWLWGWLNGKYCALLSSGSSPSTFRVSEQWMASWIHYLWISRWNHW